MLATVRDVLRAPHIGVQMLVELHRRVQFHGLGSTEPYLTGVYSELAAESDTNDEELVNKAIAYLEQYAEALGEANQQVMSITRNKQTAGELADYIAGLINLPFDTELQLLQTLEGGQRLQIVTEYLEQELRITEIRKKSSKTPAPTPTKPSANTSCASKCVPSAKNSAKKAKTP